MKPGDTLKPAASISRLPLPSDFADLDDLVAVDRHVGLIRLGAGSVDDIAAPDNEVVTHGVPPTHCSLLDRTIIDQPGEGCH